MWVVGGGKLANTRTWSNLLDISYLWSLELVLTKTKDLNIKWRWIFLVVNFPLLAGAGLGEKETLCVYRPLLIRHKSSFFRSYHGKSGSFRQRIRQSGALQ